jgi:hypothetical protein
MTDPYWAIWNARGNVDSFAAEVVAAHAAVKDKGPGTPEWEAWSGIKDRWTKRPRGRRALPGDLDGWALPGEWPHGSDVRCRRCHLPCSLAGHPHGCPRTPCDLPFQDALRPCYCGLTLVVAPETFGPCCENTPPVHVPGGCRCCGSDLCRVNEPDDFPEKNYYVDARFPEMGDAWVHAGCVDSEDLAKAPRLTHIDLVAQVEERRRRRRPPLGVYA